MGERPPDGWRTFVVVWLTQSVSLLGTAVAWFAITIWLTTRAFPLDSQKPQLAWALSALAVAFAVPTVFAAPMAGSWVDRRDRRRTMVGADLINTVLSAGLLALLARGELSVPVLVAASAAFATVGAFHSAAFDTSYVMLVPERQLPRANGMMQTIYALSSVLAPAAAATLISAPAIARGSSIPWLAGTVGAVGDGLGLALAVDGATFLLSAIVLALVVIPSPRAPAAAAGGSRLLADVKVGVNFIASRPALLWLLLTFAVANFAGGVVQVMFPLIVKFTLAGNRAALGVSLEAALALVATSASVGGLAGGIVMSVWGGLRQRRARGVVWAMVASGTAGIVLGLSPLLYLTAAMTLLVSAMTPVMNAHSQAIWQSQTPPEMQGRVFSVRRVIAQFTWPASSVLAGALGGAFPPGATIAALGAILATWSLAMIALNRPLINVGDTPREARAQPVAV